ncbi:hypothetical protein NKJ06_05755 [Mesorhizobium sp. M0293]|uniref:hypothetical protein n=1 Tax=unclassified Mesorhizobium TaxID=325217 RepID=UPI00333D9C30
MFGDAQDRESVHRRPTDAPVGFVSVVGIEPSAGECNSSRSDVFVAAEPKTAVAMNLMAARDGDLSRENHAAAKHIQEAALKAPDLADDGDDRPWQFQDPKHLGERGRIVGNSLRQHQKCRHLRRLRRFDCPADAAEQACPQIQMMCPEGRRTPLFRGSWPRRATPFARGQNHARLRKPVLIFEFRKALLPLGTSDNAAQTKKQPREFGLGFLQHGEMRREEPNLASVDDAYLVDENAGVDGTVERGGFGIAAEPPEKMFSQTRGHH